MKRSCGVLCSTLVLWAGAGSVLAQELPSDEGPRPPGSVPGDPMYPDYERAPVPTTGYPPPTNEQLVPQEIRDQPVEWQPRSRVGTALLLNGGFGDFTDSGARNATGLGGSWGLRLVSGTRTPLAIEAAYVGGANDITGAGIDEDDYLLRNGAEGALRFNVPFVGRMGYVAPFAMAGLGWTRYNLINGDGATTMSSPDDQLVVPLGGGLAASYRGFTADARFTYRLAYDDELLGSGQDMSNWGVALGLGAEF